MNDLWQTSGDQELEEAVREMQKLLPGWWWSLGNCWVTAHASVGPDNHGPDAWLMLADKTIDQAFDADISHPTTPAKALRAAMRVGLNARADAIARLNAIARLKASDPPQSAPATG